VTKLDLYQVDSFTNKLFKGNPAAIIFSELLPKSVMQKIALENNLSETAFINAVGDNLSIKWFSPLMEIDLCGHATLAAAHIYFSEINKGSSSVTFNSTKNGSLTVTKKNNYLFLDFPVDYYEPIEIDKDLISMLGSIPIEAFKGRDDIMCIFEDELSVHTIQPDMALLKLLPCRGLITTSKSSDYDFISRCFFPKTGVDEDPVTGSAHTTLTPYWSQKLAKETLLAKQVSARGGELKCSLEGDRVIIGGEAITYMKGTIFI
jgi:PhzF family phenazine biosynthesis protein